ncbi:MAG: aliphatic sulfonate ABC transporter substrate-binding protein [Rhodospirillales bacterium]|nr:aliphatic sulfonate ABC transporter substrate-binding protein [Rhodospirillales bacterium]
MTLSLQRRTLLRTAALAAPFLARGARAAETFRIGYQKNGFQVVARQRQLVEAKLKPLGISVTWTEFSFGPPLLEALRLGNVDFGSVGDTPPIFAQAAKADLVYVAAQPSGSSNAAILVPPGSRLDGLADLKGRRVAFARASSAHNLTIAAVEQAGLRFSDIVPVQLAPADAAAAFARGAVDAWTIWDPYYAIAEGQPGVRTLARAEAITAQNAFVLSSRSYAAANAPVLDAAIAAYAEAAAWSSAHRDQVAALLSAGTGVPLPAMQRAVDRSRFVIGPLTPEIIAEQQAIADRFHRIGLIPAPVRIEDAVWRPSA